MTIVITAFERSPDGGKGLARDTRVRWALEEVGQPYEVRLVSFRAMKEPAHLALHPFGQIPTYEEGDLVLFETGAIVFHLAECHAGLFPDDADARARAIAWMFAALNTVEPPLWNLFVLDNLHDGEEWTRLRRAGAVDEVIDLLAALATQVEQHLDGLARVADGFWREDAELGVRQQHDEDRVADDDACAFVVAELRVACVAQCFVEGH